MLKSTAVPALFALTLGVGGTAAAETRVYIPPGCSGLPASSAPTEWDLLRCFAPVLVVAGTERPRNQIGSPKLYRARFGRAAVRIDPDTPAIYAELRRDEIAGRRVLQLVYRIHFKRIPLRFSPYFFEAHRNTGLLILVTLDAHGLAPFFITTVQACGCYAAFIPTHRVPRYALPEDWPRDRISIFGESLPPLLPAPDAGRSRLRVFVGADRHRVVDLSVDSEPLGSKATEIALLPMQQLRSMPIEGDAQGRTGSIFYTSGPLKGHVRGAWNALEGLTLFGLAALDPTVGMDKDFGGPEETGTPFYTMIWFWKHDSSRLDRFDRLLQMHGFRFNARWGAEE